MSEPTQSITSTGSASWGVTGAVSGTGSVTGIITDIDDGAEAILAPEYNEIGQVVKQTHYDTKKTVSCTVEVAAGTAKPAPGTAITINGVAGYVLNSKLVESNQAYRKIQITAECYSNCSAVTTVGAAGGGSDDD